MIEEIHHEDEILGKAYDARLMARILRYLRPYWKLLTVSFIFLLLQTGGQLLGPYITKVAIDRYIAERDVHGLDVMVLSPAVFSSARLSGIVSGSSCASR